MDEERGRMGSKRVLMVAWLLTLGFALAVALGPSASTEECGSGAACAPSKAEMRIGREAHMREWRGRQPEICTADVCEERKLVFCKVATPPQPRLGEGHLKLPSVREPCDAKPRFRTASSRR